MSETQFEQATQATQVTETVAPVTKKPRAKRVLKPKTEEVAASGSIDADSAVGRALIDALKRAIGGDTHGAAAKQEVAAQKRVTPRKPRAPAKISDAERKRRSRIGPCASDMAKKWKSLAKDDPIRVDIETRAAKIRADFEAIHGKGRDKPKCPINKFRLLLKEARKIFPDEAFLEIRNKKQETTEATTEAMTEATSS